MENLFKLNGEQMRILHEISEKVREFERVGGLLFYDYENCEPVAVNVADCDDFLWGYCIEQEHEGEGYIDITDRLQRVPFYIRGFCYEDSLIVKVKHINKNLF